MVYNVVVAEWLHSANESVKDGQDLIYTHSMIMPGHILSQATNCLRYQETGPAARATYGSIHMKQSIGRPFFYGDYRMDHEVNYLNNPESPLVITDTAKRLGSMKIGRNLKFAVMSYKKNGDDGVVYTAKARDSGVMNGTHYNIFESDHSVTNNTAIRYNWQMDENMNVIIDPRTGFPMIDPDFSDSVILPYGDAIIVEKEAGSFPEPIRTPDDEDVLPDFRNIPVYELEPGNFYVKYGAYRTVGLRYRNTTTGESRLRHIIPGEEPKILPGYELLSLTKRDVEFGPWIHKFALAFIMEENLRDFKGSFSLKFVDPTPVFTIEGAEGEERWYGSDIVRIPRTKVSEGPFPTTIYGRTMAIRGKRAVKRGDTAVKVLEVDKNLNNRVIGVRKERFDITHGFIEDIIYGPVPKIKTGMPIGPKPGNKYAALYAQKGVCADVLEKNDTPKAIYINSVTGEREEIEPDIVFNPLAFPSRMTSGLMYEIFIAGTLDYLFSRVQENGETVRALFEEGDEELFNEYMEEKYEVPNAYKLVSELSDDTPYIYDKEE